MLVLTRNLGKKDFDEVIVECPNGDVITFQVLYRKAGGGAIRVGIDAPLDYTVKRGELRDKVPKAS